VRTAGKPEVIPADPIRAITSRWATRELIGSVNAGAFFILQWIG
jgi:hypothetical protein